MRHWLYCAATFTACSFTPSAANGYVIPMLGGGQVNAPMKQADITFDGVNLDVHVDSTISTPVLRPLAPPDEFDPTLREDNVERVGRFGIRLEPGERSTVLLSAIVGVIAAIYPAWKASRLNILESPY